MSLKLGNYSLAVLSKSTHDGEVIIEDPLYQEQDIFFRDENIIHLIKNEIMQAIELKDAPFASWLLARLWFLTNGEIKEGLNIYEENIGCQDGGWYYCQFSVGDPTNKIAVCSIGIEDPEENGKLYTYGWDGTTFLGKQSQW